MVVWLLLSCQVAKRERDLEEERERDEPFLYFFISFFNLSLSFAAGFNTLFSFYPPVFSLRASGLSVCISDYVSHPSQVTICRVYLSRLSCHVFIPNFLLICEAFWSLLLHEEVSWPGLDSERQRKTWELRVVNQKPETKKWESDSEKCHRPNEALPF